MQNTATGPKDTKHIITGVGHHSLLARDLPDTGIKPWSPSLQADSLPSESPGKPMITTQSSNSTSGLYSKELKRGTQKDIWTPMIIAALQYYQ